MGRRAKAEAAKSCKSKNLNEQGGKIVGQTNAMQARKAVRFNSSANLSIDQSKTSSSNSDVVESGSMHGYSSEAESSVISLKQQSTQAVTIYEDLAKKRSASYTKSLQTAVNHFNNFLKNNKQSPGALQYDTFDEIPTMVLGCMAVQLSMYLSYLHKTAKVMESTAMVYLSKMRNHILRANEHSDVANNRWLKDLKHGAKGEYNASGAAVSKTSDPCTMEDLHNMCDRLSAEAGTEPVVQRCAIAWLWQAVGRVGEIAALSYSDIRWDEALGCFGVTVNRFKTRGVTTDLLIFVQAKEWQQCPMHSLGCAMLAAAAGPLLFPPLQNNAASYLNRVIKGLSPKYAEFAKDLTSRSERSGAATHAAEHEQLLLHWIAYRGGWDQSQTHKMHSYLNPTRKTEKYVGRILSGHPNIHSPARCLTAQDLPPAERVTFSLFTAHLMAGAEGAAQAVQEAAMAVVVMYLPALRAKYPGHIVIRRLLSRPQEVSPERLERWAHIFQEAFLHLNDPPPAEGVHKVSTIVVFILVQFNCFCHYRS
jgi:hypothetical protein